ncbi:MAG: response regulator [bacterium]|nr:MAG: response regulator [bacterium]
MGMNKDSGTQAIITRCPNCDKTYKVHPDRLPEGVSSFPCRACGSLIAIAGRTGPEASSGEGETPAVLVAVNEIDLAQLIQRILHREGFRCLLASNGADALERLREDRVDLLLINVFLPDMMAFDVLEQKPAGEQGERVPVVLLSSVHHAARYKRAPTSLYGADDYLERHHLPDLLIPKIRRLIGNQDQRKQTVDPARMPPLTDEQVRQRRDLEEIESSTGHPDEPLMTEIRRFCRVIAGDIALYNEDIISSTQPEDLLEAISNDLKEGVELLERKFPGTGDQTPRLLREEMVRLLNSRGIQVP